MQLTGKILVAGLVASLGGVVVLLSCAVDDRPPHLGNEVPNLPGNGLVGQSSSGGPANLCECAVANFDDGHPDCQQCFHDTEGPDGGCGSQALTCTSDTDCKALSLTLYGCDGGATCISDALATLPGADKYLALLACACGVCGSDCTLDQPVACDVGDSGAPDAADPDAADGAG